jgi:hypothetical protein
MRKIDTRDFSVATRTHISLGSIYLQSVYCVGLFGVEFVQTRSKRLEGARRKSFTIRFDRAEALIEAAAFAAPRVA